MVHGHIDVCGEDCDEHQCQESSRQPSEGPKVQADGAGNFKDPAQKHHFGGEGNESGHHGDELLRMRKMPRPGEHQHHGHRYPPFCAMIAQDLPDAKEGCQMKRGKNSDKDGQGKHRSPYLDVE